MDKNSQEKDMIITNKRGSGNLKKNKTANRFMIHRSIMYEIGRK